jgi:hypothetical protein
MSLKTQFWARKVKKRRKFGNFFTGANADDFVADLELGAIHDPTGAAQVPEPLRQVRGGVRHGRLRISLFWTRFWAFFGENVVLFLRERRWRIASKSSSRSDWILEDKKEKIDLPLHLVRAASRSVRSSKKSDRKKNDFFGVVFTRQILPVSAQFRRHF